jgi:hypothetical protein
VFSNVFKSGYQLLSNKIQVFTEANQRNDIHPMAELSLKNDLRPHTKCYVDMTL